MVEPTEPSTATARDPSQPGRGALSRRSAIAAGLAGAFASSLPGPWIVRAQQPLRLSFLTIPDPDGWYPSLRLKGDWLIFEVSDGVLTGYGEASHSGDDEQCRARAEALFARYYRNTPVSLDALARTAGELAALSPDFVTATALSALNQALHELLAKREQVPVWRLFAATLRVEGVPLYATINRALQTRTVAEYLETVEALAQQGFTQFKCAPFEAVDSPDDALVKSEPGLALLARLRERFPDLGMRVDFHERFSPSDFFELLPALEPLGLDWIEEPFTMGPDYAELRARTRVRIAAGELFWGDSRFAEIATHGWADVIMPDVKHVGGFGPLLELLAGLGDRIEISPHNPSGPVSTAASLHAAALFPDRVHTLEYAFDRARTRRRYGETIERGVLYLGDAPGWGIDPRAA